MDLYLADRDDADDVDVDEMWLRDEQSVDQNAIVVAIYENPDPVSMVAVLLELGVDPNAVDDEGYPVIIHAMDNAELVQVLLDGGVDPQSTDCHGMTPLMHACAADNNEVALLLLKYTKDIQAKSVTGETALHYALGCHLDDNTEVVQALIQSGCNVNEPDGDGLLPLDIARFNYCSEEIISLLTKAGAHMGEVS
jgi:ankyrin repeat protein